MDARLQTDRLLLRPLLPEDAEPLERLAGDRAIADTMISVPHPFTSQDARDWIAAYGEPAVGGSDRYFATCLGSARQPSAKRRCIR